MSDPLLTSLCSICHVSLPKYKCPRCSIQTCSLPCTKKHKAWSECSGQRDPTTYVPRSKLLTAAGVDHDYNFLHGIELSVERSEKLLIDERGLVQQGELRPLTMQQVRWKTGRDGRKRKVLVTQVLREARGRTFEKSLAQKLRRLNVQIVCAPLGMARQKENHTTLNRRTGRINWQVEWLTLEQGGTTKRALSKVMDDVPLCDAYAGMLEEKIRAETGQVRRPTRRAGEVQCWIDGKWNCGINCAQDAANGHWTVFTGGHIDGWPAEKEALQRSQYRFYLGGQQTRSDMPSTVTALESGECLREILINTRVVEFPTIYVVKASESLPQGYVLAPKDTIEPLQNLKRKEGALGHQKAQGSTKRRKQGRGHENGEVESGNDDGAEEADGLAQGVGLEAGEIIAEQSLGEDEDEEDDTSSSGSDSGSE